ncbi:9958_t:CDS:2 [Dentiscutata erythropus]|uniref:9958_t:CDS:1 n=1 Tax=Dentiscutata erythropus TaxID=1348616 RepID=A0A9N9I316_9GLOM|nr:9958_t:CDS:2 [Dentiscutata erythropus]
MEKLTDIQKEIAGKRPLISLKVCQQKSKRDGFYSGVCGGILTGILSNRVLKLSPNKVVISVLSSSVLIGYMASYKSFSTCMADVRLKQELQKQDTALRKENTERMSDEVSRHQPQESVFTDPYNADDSKSGSKD